MARTSRKKHLNKATEVPASIQVWNVAIYVRLSVEDNGCNSDSISTQIELIEQYITERPYLKQAKIYEDNGFTGTNFSRPGFQQMMDDIHAGKITCVITKDLSRLGRNYLETCDLVEKVFPFLGVRYIAVQNHFDSQDHQNSGIQLSMALENVMNEMYAKDISKKVSTALQQKMKRGDYIGNYAPYGYQKDPQNKNHLIPDPNTAPIVQMIYQLRSEGISYSRINRQLNEQGIPSPSQLKANMGVETNFNKKAKTILWNKHMVTIILSNPVYCGHMVQRRDAQCLYQGIAPHTSTPDEQIMVFGTHEPIIDEQLFKAVQEINQKAAHKTKAAHGKYDHLPKEKNYLGSKFTCAECGATMKLVRSFNTKKTKAYFTMKCPTHQEHGSLGCADVKIRKSDLDDAILEAINTHIALFVDIRIEAQALTQAMDSTAKAVDITKKIAALEKEIHNKRELLASMYIDMKEGVLSDSDYVIGRNILNSDIEDLKNQISALRDDDELTEVNSITSGQGYWDTLVQKYQGVTEITSDVVESFIDAIQIHADGTLDIRFRYMDELEKITELCEKLRKEVVA